MQAGWLYTAQDDLSQMTPLADLLASHGPASQCHDANTHPNGYATACALANIQPIALASTGNPRRTIAISVCEPHRP